MSDCGGDGGVGMARGGERVDLFTDGACSGNPGPGGWGAILRWRDHERELFGGAGETTNNRMELAAVINGLRALKKSCVVTVHTDSQYVQKGMSQWLEGWKAKDFRVKGGGMRPNHDLWRELDALSQKHRVEWRWVKGHAGHAENERADALAHRGLDSLGLDSLAENADQSSGGR